MNKRKFSAIGILFMSLSIGLLSVNNLRAQDVNKEEKISDETVVADCANDTTKRQEPQSEIIDLPVKKEAFKTVDQMPQFPGGYKALLNYLAQNVKYPVEAQKQDIQGTVVCRFVVDSIGKVTDVKVLRSLDFSIDQEAIRVIKFMPKWTPGKQGGKAVNVYYTLPIRFRLTPDFNPNPYKKRFNNVE